MDLTDAAIQTTSEHLKLHGLKSRLTRLDAEDFPFEDGFFDVAYSWGVIRHSGRPERIISEIYRVLKPGGTFIGMIYGRRSIAAWRMWIKHAFLKAKPWKSRAKVISQHVESYNTKAYTTGELDRMFDKFREFETEPILTLSDTRRLPRWLIPYLPNHRGWFISLRGKK